MPAAKAKHPANSKAAHKPASAKRAQRLREPPRAALGKARPADAFDGPGYQFVGFRFMCRHRHVRH